MSGETKGSRQNSPTRRMPPRMKWIGAAAVAAACLAWAALTPAPQLIITTFAGGGAGDGDSALLASVNTPADVAMGANGDLYFADQENYRIRKIDAAGVITIVAGVGASGYSGDGGPATGAALGGPTGIAFDKTGNLYIADSGGARIRKINTSGIITTVAGDGNFGFGGDNGPATSAQFTFPRSVAVAADGSLYVADTGNHRVRRIDINGTITTAAGTGTAGFAGDGAAASAAQLNSPRGLAFDKLGNLYITDSGNNRIRKVDAAGMIATVAGDGTAGNTGDGAAATAAQLKNPYDVDVDSQGKLYIADAGNDRVRRIDANGIITTVAGGSARLGFPQGVAVGPGDVFYIAAGVDNVVRKVNAAGVVTTVAGNGQVGYCCDGGPATSGSLREPNGIAMGDNGDVYIADSANNRIRKVDASGRIATVAGTGMTTGNGDGGQATSADLDSPFDVAVGAAGVIYIVDSGHSRIRKIDTNGIITTVAGNGNAGYSGDGGAAVAAALNIPLGMAVDSTGNLYIADTLNHAVRKVDTAGVITTLAGNGTAGSSGDGGSSMQAKLKYPQAVAIDARTGELYISDAGNYRIRKIDSNGTITTVAGTTSGYAGDNGPATGAKLGFPHGITVDREGNLYIADLANNMVRKVDTNGIITRFAATASAYGFAGDGGPAASALMKAPSGIATDARGNVFVTDRDNHRVRVIRAAYTVGGTVAGLAGSGLVLGLNTGTETLPISVNGNFAFATALANGASYAVVVQTQPSAPAQVCSVASGSGTISGADVTNIAVTCVTARSTHTVTAAAGVGGTISPAGAQTVDDGTVLNFALAPDANYIVAGATGCGGHLDNLTYTTAPIAADCSVIATFVLAGTPVDGMCGSDNNLSLPAPPTHLCNAGTPSAVLGAGPWTWSCQGSAGGATASCSAQKATGLISTATTLSLTPNPAVVSRNVTATVVVSESNSSIRASAVSPSAATGNIVVVGNGKTCSAALVNGSASCVLLFDTPGTFTVNASYPGDSGHAGSSDARQLVVNAVVSGSTLFPAPTLDRWAAIFLMLSLGGVVAYRRVSR